ncbi:unnamed protein product [Caretta caretta]
MHPRILVCTLAVLLAACHMDTYPMYTESDGVQDFVPTDFNLAENAVGFIPDDTHSAGLRQSRSLNSVPSALEGGISQIQKAGHWKGGKETSLEDVPDNLVDNVKMILWKLAVADQLRSQGFTKSEQPPQKPSKRGGESQSRTESPGGEGAVC